MLSSDTLGSSELAQHIHGQRQRQREKVRQRKARHGSQPLLSLFTSSLLGLFNRREHQVALGCSEEHPALSTEDLEERPGRVDAGEHARAHKRVLHQNHTRLARGGGFARVHRHSNAQALDEGAARHARWFKTTRSSTNIYPSAYSLVYPCSLFPPYLRKCAQACSAIREANADDVSQLWKVARNHMTSQEAEGLVAIAIWRERSTEPGGKR